MSVSASALELAWAHCHNGMYFKTLLWYTKFNTIPAQNHKPSNAIFMYRYVPKNVHIEDIKWNIIQLGNVFTLVQNINILTLEVFWTVYWMKCYYHYCWNITWGIKMAAFFWMIKIFLKRSFSCFKFELMVSNMRNIN